MPDELNAPVGDQNGPAGQGGEETSTPTDYAGHETPEALAESYTNLVTEKTSLQEQISDLERIKGTQGNELGQLRNQVAQLSGQIEVLKSIPQQAQPQGPTLDDIARQLESGEIDEAQAIRRAAEVSEQNVSTRLGQQFKNMLQKEVGNIRQQYQQEKYVQNFLKNNPGYEEAYNQGKLNKWIDRGIPGETAWLHYKIEAGQAQIKELEQQSATAAKRAEENGFNNGIKTEKGKSAAGKVLTGKGGKFSQVTGNHNLGDPNQRRQAGIELLQKMRGGE